MGCRAGRRSPGVTVERKEARRNDAVLIAAASADHVTGDSALCISLGNLPPTGDDHPEPGFLLLSELPLLPPREGAVTAGG